MTASGRTANFALCQWDESDPVLREDFNRDNLTIDAALTQNAGAAAAAASAGTSALRNSRENAMNIYNIMLSSIYNSLYIGAKRAMVYDALFTPPEGSRCVDRETGRAVLGAATAQGDISYTPETNVSAYGKTNSAVGIKFQNVFRTHGRGTLNSVTLKIACNGASYTNFGCLRLKLVACDQDTGLPPAVTTASEHIAASEQVSLVFSTNPSAYALHTFTFAEPPLLEAFTWYSLAIEQTVEGQTNTVSSALTYYFMGEKASDAPDRLALYSAKGGVSSASMYCDISITPQPVLSERLSISVQPGGDYDMVAAMARCAGTGTVLLSVDDEAMTAGAVSSVMLPDGTVGSEFCFTCDEGGTGGETTLTAMLYCDAEDSFYLYDYGAVYV